MKRSPSFYSTPVKFTCGVRGRHDFDNAETIETFFPEQVPEKLAAIMRRPPKEVWVRDPTGMIRWYTRLFSGKYRELAEHRNDGLPKEAAL